MDSFTHGGMTSIVITSYSIHYTKLYEDTSLPEMDFLTDDFAESLPEDESLEVNLSSSPLSGSETLDEEAEIVFDEGAIELETDTFARDLPVSEEAPSRTESVFIPESEEISLDMFDSEQEEAIEEVPAPISEEALQNIEFEDISDLSSSYNFV